MTDASVALSPEHGIVVYSCYFGKYEPLNLTSMGDGEGYDRVIFTDDPDLAYPGAKVVTLAEPALDALYLSRKPKLKPHLYFQEYEWAIYVDNRANLTTSPSQIIAEIVDSQGGDAPSGRYLFKHPDRNCVYRESKVCRRMGSISEEEFDRLNQCFARIGIPKGAGLFVNTMMVQKMGSAHADLLNDRWYEAFLHYCKRDQVTLGMLAWLHPEGTRVLPMQSITFMDWPVFSFKDRRRFRRHGTVS